MKPRNPVIRMPFDLPPLYLGDVVRFGLIAAAWLAFYVATP